MASIDIAVGECDEIWETMVDLYSGRKPDVVGNSSLWSDWGLPWEKGVDADDKMYLRVSLLAGGYLTIQSQRVQHTILEGQIQSLCQSERLRVSFTTQPTEAGGQIPGGAGESFRLLLIWIVETAVFTPGILSSFAVGPQFSQFPTYAPLNRMEGYVLRFYIGALASAVGAKTIFLATLNTSWFSIAPAGVQIRVTPDDKWNTRTPLLSLGFGPTETAVNLASKVLEDVLTTNEIIHRNRRRLSVVGTQLLVPIPDEKALIPSAVDRLWQVLKRAALTRRSLFDSMGQIELSTATVTSESGKEKGS